MKNSLCDLNDYLFECLEGLMDDDMSPEEMAKQMERAKAINGIAKTIIDNASTQVDALRLQVQMKEFACGELPEMMLPKNTSKNGRLKGLYEKSMD